MADEATLKLMADQGVWLSLQAFEAGDNPLTPAQIKKAEPTSHWDRVAGWGKSHGTKVAFGTDLLFQPDGTGKQPVMLTRFAKVFGDLGTLRIATSGNCELFAMSGERNPYKEAKLGVLQRGAWADTLLVNGDPTQDINVLKDYERNLAVIIKNGKVCKNICRSEWISGVYTAAFRAGREYVRSSRFCSPLSPMTHDPTGPGIPQPTPLAVMCGTDSAADQPLRP